MIHLNHLHRNTTPTGNMKSISFLKLWGIKGFKKKEQKQLLQFFFFYFLGIRISKYFLILSENYSVSLQQLLLIWNTHQSAKQNNLKLTFFVFVFF